MNQYRCETCKENCKYSPNTGQAYCLVDGMWELRENVKMINNFTQECGCASHSDFQSGRDIKTHPCSGCGCMLDDNLGCPEMKTCLDYHICKVARISRDKVLDEFVSTLMKRCCNSIVDIEHADIPTIHLDELAEIIKELRTTPQEQRHNIPEDTEVELSCNSQEQP